MYLCKLRRSPIMSVIAKATLALAVPVMPALVAQLMMDLVVQPTLDPVAPVMLVLADLSMAGLVDPHIPVPVVPDTTDLEALLTMDPEALPIAARADLVMQDLAALVIPGRVARGYIVLLFVNRTSPVVSSRIKVY
jgi:hypothetical protein